MARCRDCWVLREHPEIVDEAIVFGQGCPARKYGFDCPDAEFVFGEQMDELEPWEVEWP